ncbi:MAG TPA: UDP-2,3-diacylglucosamine diphosphatase [Candidatus Binataceae bacterium]|jgi:UDP-2,3-diacylglucosamine pyrophosphatase LpxH|nr:UDP-2,3-diacylglucosamine diphosphatase [Candidatus Binataceae bacterium]
MGEYGLSQGGWSVPGIRVAAAHRRRCLRSIWISDLHLGTRRCRAADLLEFLRQHQADNLYLVGDIVDGWVTGPAWHWSRAQGDVVRTITSWHRQGVRVVFLPGNHDEVSIDVAHALLGPLPVATELIHRTAEGRRMLVIHGHQFDGSLNPNRWMSIMGAQAYHQALRIDRWYSEEAIRACERPASPASYFKRRLSKAVRYLTDFGDRSVVRTARLHKADGVICGHTHYPEHRAIGSISYINEGDWVKSCTALVEEHDGTLRLLRRDGASGGWIESDHGAERAAS